MDENVEQAVEQEAAEQQPEQVEQKPVELVQAPHPQQQYPSSYPQPIPQPRLTPEEFREKVWTEGTDEYGNPKNLGYKLILENRFPRLEPGEPHPSQFPANEEGEKEFTKALDRHRSKTDMVNALHEVLGPKPGIEALLPDDEHREERHEANEWYDECMEKADKYRRNGFYSKAQDWEERATFKLDELKSKGPIMAEKVAKQLLALEDFKGLMNLGEPSLAGHQIWSDPRMSHDAAIVMHRFNQENHVNVLILPKEKTPYGDLEPIAPENMVHIELPHDVWEWVTYRAYKTSGAKDSDGYSKALWAALRKKGYGDSATPTIKKPSRPERSEKSEPKTFEDRIKNMSQKEFNALRVKAGARPF
jgi:hypothetical protein